MAATDYSALNSDEIRSVDVRFDIRSNRSIVAAHNVKDWQTNIATAAAAAAATATKLNDLKIILNSIKLSASRAQLR